ncbi:17521_t:CDS:2, partial [Funneliformis caledonium]
GSSVVDRQSQKDRETIAEISAIDESDSVIDQQNDVNTKGTRSRAVQSEWFDSHPTDRKGDSWEKNLDSEPFIADISGINSQDSVIPLNEKDEQDVYLASLSSELCVASPGFEYSKDGKVPYKQKVEKGL